MMIDRILSSCCESFELSILQATSNRKASGHELWIIVLINDLVGKIFVGPKPAPAFPQPPRPRNVHVNIFVFDWGHITRSLRLWAKFHEQLYKRRHSITEIAAESKVDRKWMGGGQGYVVYWCGGRKRSRKWISKVMWFIGFWHFHAKRKSSKVDFDVVREMVESDTRKPIEPHT